MNDKPASSRLQPDLDDRQTAERKLCHLFESFGIDALQARDQLIDPFMERAVDFWRPHGGADYGTLAVGEAETALEAWFASLLQGQLDEKDQPIMVGRAAFLMCDGPKLWSGQLLLPEEDLSETFVKALRDSVPQAVPPSAEGEMEHQPYEAWSPTDTLSRVLPQDYRFLTGFFGSLTRQNAMASINYWRGAGPRS